MKNDSIAKVMLSVSMVIFGTLGLFTRNISLSSGELALYRAVLASGVILIYFAVSKQRMDLNVIKKEIPLLLVSGMAMGINWILLFQAYKYTTISAATLSYYFAPVIVTITCPFLFHEKLTGKQITCFCMSTVGLFLIIGIGNVGQGSNNLLGILLGLGAAVFYAAVILLNKFIKNVAGVHRTLLQFFCSNSDFDSLCGSYRRHAFGGIEHYRMDMFAYSWDCPYRNYLLYVFFRTKRFSRA